MYYLIVFLILSFLSFFELIVVNKKIELLLSILAFGCIFFTSAFKYETGVDWVAYTATFKDLTPVNHIFSRNSNVFNDLNFGYNLFSSVVKYFTGNIQVLFFLMASLSGIFIIKGLNIYNVNIPIAILLYYSMVFFVLDMSGVRQCLAVAIFFYSIKFVKNHQFLPYFFYILVATSFHWSAALLLPFYFFGNRKVSNKICIVYFLVSICILVFKINWVGNVILSIFPVLENDILIKKLFVYSTNSSFAIQRGLTPFTIVNIVFYILIFAFALSKRDELEKSSKYFGIFFNVFLLQVFAFFCLSEFIDMAERLKLYFMLSNMCIFFYFISILVTPISKFIMYLLIVFYSAISARTFIFNAEFTIAYQPYQNYIICKLFGIESTSTKRISAHKMMNE